MTEEKSKRQSPPKENMSKEAFMALSPKQMCEIGNKATTMMNPQFWIETGLGFSYNQMKLIMEQVGCIRKKEGGFYKWYPPEEGSFHSRLGEGVKVLSIDNYKIVDPKNISAKISSKTHERMVATSKRIQRLTIADIIEIGANRFLDELDEGLLLTMNNDVDEQNNE